MHKFFSMAQQYAGEITCEFIWCMDERRYGIRLFSDWSISFRSFPEDGSQRVQNHDWTERQGRWIILNWQFGHLILFFNYRGAGFARRMASVSLNRDGLLFLEGFDYRERQIRMYPVAARHTGHNNEVTDAAWVLNVLAGRFDRWPRL